MKREFTGRHMAVVLVIGFGIVVAVNLLMATLAVRGFGGVVVENSYVASQKFNGWLAEAERQKALGWEATVERMSDGRLLVRTRAVPDDAQVRAVIRRPLGQPETTAIAFSRAGPGRFVTTAAVPAGRWIVRLTVGAPGRHWSMQEQIG